MLMPSLLPDNLQFCEKAASQIDLFEILVRRPPDLILFLEIASRDEFWAEANPEFMQKAVVWAHTQFFQDHLLMEFAQRLAKVFREHPSSVKAHLPLNITIKLKDKDIPINTLFYGSSSEYLHGLIRLECRDRRAKNLYLKDYTYDFFSVVDEYIQQGNLDSVYVKDKDTVVKILELALIWDLQELSQACQVFLKKWISRDNIFETLLTAHKKGWYSLRSDCFEYVNFLSLDMRFVDSPPERLAFEFLRFTESSMEVFNKFRHYITDLIFSGTTTDDEQFSKTVNKCPHLICLDISYSKSFTDFLKDIPSNLEELVLSACNWLNNEKFTFLMQICPNLTKLVLQSIVELNFEAWGVFQKMPKLRTLDLTRCSQIGNEDIRLILQASETLISLTLEECRGITDIGFFEIPKLGQKMTALNLARTNISDQPLIEIGNQCPDLNYLDLTRCEKITEKGLLETVRAARNLRELNISLCDIPNTAIAKIKAMRPYLKLIN